MRLAWLTLVFASLIAAGPLLSQPRAHGTQSQTVTMTFVRFFDVACNCFKARVSGRVSSGRAGEYVVVLEEFCGRGSGRSVVAATTREGGSWDALIDAVVHPESGVAVSYRARWNAALSDPVFFRGRLESLAGKRAGRGRQTVTVVTPRFNPVNLKGRLVVLQRRVSGAWRRLATARLSTHRARFYTFTATFSVPRRGWTLRALVPSKTAAPCFAPQTSEPWRS